MITWRSLVEPAAITCPSCAHVVFLQVTFSFMWISMVCPHVKKWQPVCVSSQQSSRLSFRGCFLYWLLEKTESLVWKIVQTNVTFIGKCLEATANEFSSWQSATQMPNQVQICPKLASGIRKEHGAGFETTNKRHHKKEHTDFARDVFVSTKVLVMSCGLLNYIIFAMQSMFWTIDLSTQFFATWLILICCGPCLLRRGLLVLHTWCCQWWWHHPWCKIPSCGLLHLPPTVTRRRRSRKRARRRSWTMWSRATPHAAILQCGPHLMCSLYLMCQTGRQV